MRAKARFFYYLLFIIFIQIVLVSSAAAATRIMPLGDSITKGYDSFLPDDEWAGYREKLYSDLIDQGYDIDFVGSQDNGTFADPWHEGHGGFEADKIWDNIYLTGSDYLGSNPADVILLHIGTNDISGDQPTDDIVDEVEQILVKIEEFEFDIGKDVPVLLALIILRDDFRTADTMAFNNAVRTMAEARIDDGDNIIIVEMQNALSYPNDLADEVHPNMTGYNKMADVWFSALQEILPAADAGSNQSVDEGDTVMLDGLNSKDPGNSDYFWEQTEGTPVTISDPTVVQPIFTAPDVESLGETLIFRLTVTTSTDFEATDTTTVKVNDIPDDPPNNSSSSGGGGCFITTATNGSYLEPHVTMINKSQDPL